MIMRNLFIFIVQLLNFLLFLKSVGGYGRGYDLVDNLNDGDKLREKQNDSSNWVEYYKYNEELSNRFFFYVS